MRFPQDWDDATPAATAALAPAGAAVMGNALALLSPEPMVRQAVVGNSAGAQAAAPQPRLQMAVAEVGPVAAPAPVSLPRANSSVAQPANQAKPAQAVGETKPNPAAPHRHPDRPSFILNDAQIASIKQRLHLTEYQEQMWPAVEAALRNIAYARAREARRRGPAAATQVAAVDPNSIEVQGLKDAAVPLIMSFDSEQRDEVRNLAHVMGLDHLANQF